MSQYITKIRTESGDLLIDYNALANLPESDTTLSEAGKFADAKSTGDAINNAINDVKSLMDEQLMLKANVEDVDKQLATKANVEDVNEQLDLKSDLEYVDEQLTLKADTEFVNSQLQLKADAEYVSEQLNLKADQEQVSEQLDLKADIEYVNSQLELQQSPYNYLVNSDFTKFVAQAGLGVSPFGGSANVYAGDRWFQYSEDLTVEGELNQYGYGYSGIKLNGEIIQRVPVRLDKYTCGIKMISGSATIAYVKYDDYGEVIIKSDGGVLESAWLYEGVYNYTPDYKPKGYDVELAECKRFSMHVQNGSGYINSSADRANIFIPNTLYKEPNVDQIVVYNYGSIFTCGQKITPTEITSVTKYTPSNDIRISFAGTYPEKFNSAMLCEADLWIDISPELYE